MATTTLFDARNTGRTAHQAAQTANPIPPEHLTWTADIAIRFGLALMPFSAIVWTFVAH